MRLLERQVEGPVVAFAKKHRVEVVKLNGMGKRSLPDRMFLYGTRVLFIEFKRPGEEPTEAQWVLHERWRKLGHRVYVVDAKDEGVRLIKLVLLSTSCKHTRAKKSGPTVGWCLDCGSPVVGGRGRWKASPLKGAA